MSAPQLTLRDIARRLRDDEALPAMPAELWPRIVAAHRQRARQARQRRFGAAAAFVLVAAVAAVVRFGGERAAEPVDWQARAQALELQLRAAEVAPVAAGAPAFGELARVDAALQAAYDDGAEAKRIEALWKRRSELLDVLLRVRRENIEISRI